MKFSQLIDELRNYDEETEVMFDVNKSLKKRKLTEEFYTQLNYTSQACDNSRSIALINSYLKNYI